MKSKTKTVIIAGPTASGKSDIALKICGRFDGELVSSDSMQIYKHLDIGTAKPSKEEQAAVRHHLIDIAEPYENYSAADFARDCKSAIEDITKRGKLPVVCGGTGLYIEALLHPTDYSVSADVDAGLRDALLSRDNHELWLELQEKDPESAAAIHENNKKRVVRALEIYHKTGMKKSELDKIQKKNDPEYDILLLLTGFYDRAVLYDRINARVEKMIESGLVCETEYLIEKGLLREGTTAYQAIGYKELFPYFRKEKTLSECVDKLKQATRNYAKRQLTWFSAYDGIRINCYEDAERAVSEFLKKGGEDHG